MIIKSIEGHLDLSSKGMSDWECVSSHCRLTFFVVVNSPSSWHPKSEVDLQEKTQQRDNWRHRINDFVSASERTFHSIWFPTDFCVCDPILDLIFSSLLSTIESCSHAIHSCFDLLSNILFFFSRRNMESLNHCDCFCDVLLFLERLHWWQWKEKALITRRLMTSKSTMKMTKSIHVPFTSLAFLLMSKRECFGHILSSSFHRDLIESRTLSLHRPSLAVSLTVDPVLFISLWVEISFMPEMLSSYHLLSLFFDRLHICLHDSMRDDSFQCFVEEWRACVVEGLFPSFKLSKIERPQTSSSEFCTIWRECQQKESHRRITEGEGNEWCSSLCIESNEWDNIKTIIRPRTWKARSWSQHRWRQSFELLFKS